MKALKSVLTISAAFLLAWPVIVYSGDSGSSGVIVIGPEEKSASKSISGETEASAEKESNSGSGAAKSKGSLMVMYEIKGSRIGDTQVSDAVTLPADGAIVAIDPGMGNAFVIVRVDAEGKEALALNVSPEHAIGQRLTKGTYKLYPQDPDRRFVNEKLTARAQVGLTDANMEDPRARGDKYKAEKEQ
ncbi:MAG: hypothetical protein PHT50_01170 [Candidatus Omnitrophica bacterium]|nr:hypothetical protein [Candidatus Omnitrophota bacterium]